jgi:hypothetical protein
MSDHVADPSSTPSSVSVLVSCVAGILFVGAVVRSCNSQDVAEEVKRFV